MASSLISGGAATSDGVVIAFKHSDEIAYYMGQYPSAYQSPYYVCLLEGLRESGFLKNQYKTLETIDMANTMELTNTFKEKPKMHSYSFIRSKYHKLKTLIIQII